MGDHPNHRNPTCMAEVPPNLVQYVIRCGVGEVLQMLLWPNATGILDLFPK